MNADTHRLLYEQHIKLASEVHTMARRTNNSDLTSIALAMVEIGNVYYQASQELAREEREMNLKLRRLAMTLFVILIVLLLGTVIVGAQDPTNEPIPTLVPVETPAPPVEAIPVEQAGYELLAAIVAIIGTAVSAPATLFVVSVLKRIPLLNGVSSRALQVFVAGLLVVGVWVARFVGVEVQFESLLNAIQVAGPVVLQFVLTLIGSGAAYSYASLNDVPIVGYQRQSPNKYYVKSVGENGQGLVEYALILVLVSVVVIVVLALLGPAIGNVFSQIVAAIDPNALPTPGS